MNSATASAFAQQEAAAKKFHFTEKQLLAIKLFNSPAREILLYGGSRAAKTFVSVAYIIYRACKCGKDLQGKPMTQAICRLKGIDVINKLYRQEWQAVMHLVFPEYENKVHFNKVDRIATFPNGALVRFGGLDDGSRNFGKILGDGLTTILFNECSEIPFKAYSTASTRLSQLNPKIKGVNLEPKFLLDMNPTHKRWWVYRVFLEHVWPGSHGATVPIENPEKFAALLMNPQDNLENLPPGYLESLRNLPPDMQKRFLYGEFADFDEDTVYEELILDARVSGRITKVFRDPRYPIYAVFDLGLNDATAVWVCQFLPDRILFLDYIEGVQQATTNYIVELYAREWDPHTIILPNDAHMRAYGDLHTLVDILWDFRNKAKDPRIKYNVEVIGKPRLAPSIDLCRMFFHLCWFDDDNCAKGLDSLGNYRFKRNELLGSYADKPSASWARHGADAFRYAMIAYRSTEIKKAKPVRDPKYTYMDEILDWNKLGNKMGGFDDMRY